MSAETLAVNRQQASRRRATAVFLGVCLFNFAGYGLIINCFGLFLSPVSVAQNISITEISLTHTVRTLCGMAGTVLAGRLMPRYDLRKYLALVCLGLAGAAVLTARSTVFWHFMLSAALLGFAAGLGIYTLVPLVISEWFTAPGGYIGLATACGGLGGIVFSPVLARVIQCRGWQAGYLLIAAVALLVMLPAGVFLIRFRPGELGLEPCTGKKTVRAGGGRASRCPWMPGSHRTKRPTCRSFTSSSACSSRSRWYRGPIPMCPPCFVPRDTARWQWADSMPAIRWGPR